MKGKVIDSQYLPGYSSYVAKQTKYGTFYSEIFLQDEDKDIDNSFDGCRIAEFDCNIKMAKEKAKWMRQRAIGVRVAYTNILNSIQKESNLDKNDVVLQKLEQQVQNAFNEADRAKEYYERMKDYRPIYIENLLKRRRETRNLIKNH